MGINKPIVMRSVMSNIIVPVITEQELCVCVSSNYSKLVIHTFLRLFDAMQQFLLLALNYMHAARIWSQKQKILLDRKVKIETTQASKFADEQQKNNAKSSRQTILETKMFKLKNQLINCKLIKRSMW